MGLTQNINGFECELRHASTIMHQPLDLCGGCPLRREMTGKSCATGYGKHPCTDTALREKLPSASMYVWFSPVLYELNKE